MRPTKCGSSSLRPEYRLAVIVRQVPQIPVVLLTDVFRQFTVRIPRHVPAYGPWPRVRAGVVDRRFVAQRTLVGPRDTFDNVQHVRMRMSVVVDPRTLVEADD